MEKVESLHRMHVGDCRQLSDVSYGLLSLYLGVILSLVTCNNHVHVTIYVKCCQNSLTMAHVWPLLFPGMLCCTSTGAQADARTRYTGIHATLCSIWLPRVSV
jgi:hypothetical protein